MDNIDTNVELNENFKKKLKKSKDTKFTILNIALIITIFIGLFAYMLIVDGLNNIVIMIKSVDYFWVFLGIICMVLSWLFEAMCLHVPIKNLYPNQKFLNSVRIMMIGGLFNNITPFCSGRATNASLLYV